MPEPRFGFAIAVVASVLLSSTSLPASAASGAAASGAAAPRAAAPARSWQLERAHLAIALACTKGKLADAALDTAVKGFGANRRSSWKLVQRSELPQLSEATLRTLQEGLPEKERAALGGARSVVMVVFDWPRADAAALAEAYAVTAGLADRCQAAVADLETLNAFSSADWKARRVALAKAPVVAWKHFAIHMVENEDGSFLLDTGGLSRFGLAELALPRVLRSELRSAGSMLNLVVQRLAEGAQPDDNGQVWIRLADLRDPAMRKSQLAATRENAQRALLIEPVPAPEPEDASFVLRFPGLSCGTPDECLDAALSQLFGSRDGVKMVRHDAKVNEARKRAQAALKAYEPKLAKGFPPREYLLVKGPFQYPDGTEWMWIEVQQWKDGVLRGVLRSDPSFVKDLRAGAAVQVRESDVFDYMYRLADGSFYGNETGKVMQPELFEELGGGRARIRE